MITFPLQYRWKKNISSETNDEIKLSQLLFSNFKLHYSKHLKQNSQNLKKCDNIVKALLIFYTSSFKVSLFNIKFIFRVTFFHV